MRFNQARQSTWIWKWESRGNKWESRGNQGKQLGKHGANKSNASLKEENMEGGDGRNKPYINANARNVVNLFKSINSRFKKSAKKSFINYNQVQNILRFLKTQTKIAKFQKNLLPFFRHFSRWWTEDSLLGCHYTDSGVCIPISYFLRS